jgi:four helix bundle protein
MIDILRRNLNRGYMKLEVWNDAVSLFELVYSNLAAIHIDLKSRSQIIDSAQSVSANIAEGYCRKQ